MIHGTHGTHGTHGKGSKLFLEEESYRLLGACFEVYKDKGCGFLEPVYQECLRCEFDLQGIPAIEKPIVELEYKGRQLAQRYIPDFICFQQIIVELKAMAHLAEEHSAQVMNYLKATKKRLALLVNFGHYPRLEYVRVAANDKWDSALPDFRA